MAGRHDVRRAHEGDVDRIMEILHGRQAWLRETKLSAQWATVGEWRQLLCYLIRRGNVWVLVDRDAGGWIVGTVTVSADPDRDFWNPDDRRVPALYVSKLATDVACKGQELGSFILDWVRDYAAARGVGVLRLDTWKTSNELREYYEKRGWRHVGLADLGHRQSGHLFERDTADAVSLAVGPATGAFALPSR